MLFCRLYSLFSFYPLDEFGRIAAYDGHGRHIVRYYAVGTDDGTIADAHAGQDSGTDAYPHLIFYHYRAAVGRTAVVGIRVVVDGDEVHFRGDEHAVADGDASTVEEGDPC